MAQLAVEVGRCGSRGAAPRVRARGTRVWPTGPASACGFVVHCCWMRLALAVQLVLRYSGVSRFPDACAAGAEAIGAAREPGARALGRAGVVRPLSMRRCNGAPAMRGVMIARWIVLYTPFEEYQFLA